MNFSQSSGPVEGFSAGLKDESNLYEVCKAKLEPNARSKRRLIEICLFFQQWEIIIIGPAGMWSKQSCSLVLLFRSLILACPSSSQIRCTKVAFYVPSSYSHLCVQYLQAEEMQMHTDIQSDLQPIGIPSSTAQDEIYHSYVASKCLWRWWCLYIHLARSWNWRMGIRRCGREMATSPYNWVNCECLTPLLLVLVPHMPTYIMRSCLFRFSQLLSVISLLSSDTPNVDSPANVDAAKQVRGKWKD